MQCTPKKTIFLTIILSAYANAEDFAHSSIYQIIQMLPCLVFLIHQTDFLQNDENIHTIGL